MRFIETNKHRQIEKETMELAMSWYYRYIEKEEQIEKIEQSLRAFERWFMSREDGNIQIGDIQREWDRIINI